MPPKLIIAPKKIKTASTEASKNAVSIDYPKPGEIIASNHYTLRIGAADASSVHVSIDASAWQPCRKAVGYWWFDWAALPGRHQVRAQAAINGATSVTAQRRFSVTLGEFTRN